MAPESTHYTVQEATFKKDLPATAQRGPLKVWALKLTDPDGAVIECERNKKPGNEFKVGQVVFGYTKQTDYGLRLEEVVEQGAPTNNTGNKGGDGQYDRKPDHPINVARARHAAAMGSTPAYYTLLREESVIPKPESKDNMVKTLEGIMTWLESTYPKDPRGE